jgi:hypothetical protein
MFIWCQLLISNNLVVLVFYNFFQTDQSKAFKFTKIGILVEKLYFAVVQVKRRKSIFFVFVWLDNK